MEMAPYDEKVRDRLLGLTELIVIFGFAAAFVYHYVMAYYLNRPVMDSIFLFPPNDAFMDFFNTVKVATSPKKMFWTYNYNPFTYLISCGLARIPHLAALLMFLGGFVAAFYAIAWRQVRSPHLFETVRRLIVFSFLTYPVLFALDRGNFEMYVFLLVWAFAVFYHSRAKVLCLLPLALAIAIKPFPVVFLVLLLADSRYRDTAVVLGVAAVLTVLGLVLFDGGLAANVARYQKCMAYQYQTWVISGDGNGILFQTTLWSLIQVFVIGYQKVHGACTAQDISQGLACLSKYYIAGTGVVFCLVAVFVLRAEKVLWRRVAVLTVAMNLLPQVSADYRLLYLLIPLFLFVNSPEGQRDGKLRWVYAVIFGLLLIPKNYGHLPWIHPWANLGVVINPLLMLALGVLIVCETLAGRRRDRRLRPAA